MRNVHMYVRTYAVCMYVWCFQQVVLNVHYIFTLGLVVWYMSLDQLRSHLLPVNKEQLLVEIHDRQPLVFALNTSPKQLSLHSSWNTPATTSSHTTTVSKDTTRTTAATSDTTSVTSATSKATITTTQHVTVQNIKNLYDSHMVVSQGIKLKWIRNRMMA